MSALNRSSVKGSFLARGTNYASDIRMHMHPFLLECGRVSDNAGLQSKQAETLGCSIDVVAKGLTAKGAFACQGKGVSLPDPREVGSDGVNSNALFYTLCRLLVVSLAIKPTGKMM